MWQSNISGGSVVKNWPANAGEVGSIPGLGGSLGRKWQPTLVFLPGESHGQRSLVGYSPWGRHSLATEQQQIFTNIAKLPYSIILFCLLGFLSRPSYNLRMTISSSLKFILFL